MTDITTDPLKRTDITVLVVEDEALVRMNATVMLEAAGFYVHEAQCGASGLAQLERHPEVMVLFSDINMPGDFDGLELARQIHVLRPDIRLLLTSGLMRPSVEELSGGDFIAKPYDDGQVTEMIHASLARPPVH